MFSIGEGYVIIVMECFLAQETCLPDSLEILKRSLQSLKKVRKTCFTGSALHVNRYCQDNITVRISILIEIICYATIATELSPQEFQSSDS